MLLRSALALFCCLTVHASVACAGNTYKITSQDGEQSLTYEVSFGGGRSFERYTAFDPATNKFVYLDWKRTEEPPQAAMQLWDHRTGKTVSLYEFPGAKHPLPRIPSVEAMKVCPFTGDEMLKAKLYVIYD